jgi:hypothetical protein
MAVLPLARMLEFLDVFITHAVICDWSQQSCLMHRKPTRVGHCQDLRSPIASGQVPVDSKMLHLLA